MIVFENSAVSDAERFNYTMEDFFSFWEGLEYSLYTVFGKRHDRANWGKRHAHDLFAIPNERNAEDLAIIHLAILGASSQLICAKP
jgi:hypothetical protein